ncbi:MAG TPA: hypothetical protein VH228_18065, partial [Nocardioides sp.]|nr:hypothetical protein [Nocardioides sp.]
MSTRQAPARGEPLRDFLADWRVHLRAKNRSKGTIESYLTCGTSLCDWLDGQPYGANLTDVTSRVLEAYLAQMHERVAPATVAKHYRS